MFISHSILLTEAQKVTVLSPNGSMLAVASSHDVCKSIFCTFGAKTVALVFTPVISILDPDCGAHPPGKRNLRCYILRKNGEDRV